MNKIAVLAVALTLLAGPLSAAQLYRWVDEKGQVEWRDTPPPPHAKKVEQRRLGTSPPPAVELPYSVQQAMKNFPVTLWITNCGDNCDRARAHLARRGVPYTDRNPEADFEGFKKVSAGSLEVPLLIVGGNVLRGYLESDWDAALDIAGYPKTALVAVKPKPAPPAKEVPAAAAKAPPGAPPAVKLYTSPQCGLQCDQAKALLGSRGVGFQEVAVAGPSELEELKNVSGSIRYPTLLVGRLFLQGFDAPGYHALLDQEGFRRAP